MTGSRKDLSAAYVSLSSTTILSFGNCELCRRTKWEPMKPAPPVTSKFMCSMVSVSVHYSLMKGILICGGKGTRLLPLTAKAHKSLLPIGGKPMVLYPLQVLLDAGIKEIMLITGPEFAGDFMQCLGSGKLRPGDRKSTRLNSSH